MLISPSTSSEGADSDALESRWRLAFVAARLSKFIREEPLQAVPLILLTFLAAGLAVAVIDQPIRCDEAGTYLDFVRYGVAHVISDYSSTNNHILYSLAAKVSVKLFGSEAWSLRVPALLAGVVLVPTTYLALRSHFTSAAALVGAGLVATSPYLVDQATNGRGYSMLNVCFMLLLALVPHLLVARGYRAWLLFALLGAIGTYAVPIMLFPLGIVGTWLVIGMICELPPRRWIRFTVRLALGCLALGAIAGLFYAPTFFGQEEKQVIVTGARFDSTLKPMTRWDRVLGLGDWVSILWGHVVHGLPRGLAWCSLVLAAIGVLGGRRRWMGLRFLTATVVGFAGVVFVSQRQPPMWSMSFLIPLYLGLAAGGAAVLGRVLWSARPAIVPALTLLILGGAQGAAALDNAGKQGELPWYMGYFDAEEASLRIDQDLPPRSPIAGIGRQLGPIYFYQDGRGDKTPGNMDRDGFLEAREVFFIDSGVAKSARMMKGLERWGFEPTDDVIELPSSRIICYELVREPTEDVLRGLRDSVGVPDLESGEELFEDDGSGR